MRKCPNCKNPAVATDTPEDTLCPNCKKKSVRVEVKPTTTKK